MMDSRVYGVLSNRRRTVPGEAPLEKFGLKFLLPMGTGAVGC